MSDTERPPRPDPERDDEDRSGTPPAKPHGDPLGEAADLREDSEPGGARGGASGEA